uniref:Putative secreted protein n=1 Tax=Anopheles darlingi TaxID=43151 RepID=A0A2M4DI61_ANODA
MQNFTPLYLLALWSESFLASTVHYRSEQHFVIQEVFAPIFHRLLPCSLVSSWAWQKPDKRSGRRSSAVVVC